MAQRKEQQRPARNAATAKEAREDRRGEARAGPRERRSASRVRDDQSSGHGAASAFSRFRMLERRRAWTFEVKES